MKIALASLLILLSAIFLYPDTPYGPGFTIGAARIGAVKILFLLCSLSILMLIINRRHFLRLCTLDFSIAATIIFFSVRGLLAAETVNEIGRILVYVGLTIIVYYGIAVMAQNRDVDKAIFLFFAVNGVVIGLYALLEFSLNKNLLYDGIDLAKNNLNFHRSGSTIAHPVILGLFLVQVAPFLIYMYVEAKTKLKRHLYIGAITILTLALGVTFSKSAWLTALVMIGAVIVWFIFNKPQPRRLLMILFISLGITFLVFNLSFSGSVDSALMSDQRMAESISGRKYMWSLAPPAFMEQPLFGFGMWKGGSAIASVELQNKGQEKLGGQRAIDNLYLTTIVEQGLFGSLLALIMITLIFQNGFKLRQKGHGFEKVALPALFSMIAALIGGLFYDSLLVRQNMIVFLISAGMLRALTLERENHSLQMIKSEDNLERS